MRKVVIQKKTYRDSVNLMLLSDQVRRLPGIIDVAVLMGTPSNKQRLVRAGYAEQSFLDAGAGDLCIGIEADAEQAMEKAWRVVNDFISGKSAEAHGSRPARGASYRTLRSALRALPGAQLASISVPGEFAAAEARKALEAGLHVFLFSNNVSLQEEKNLKALARQRGLLLMGPDCGTALIHGFPLGFCNQVPRGPVGIVAASGTGAQELMSLLAARNIGISHVLGTGGRDLNEEIGGLMFETAMQTLGEDENTRVIILVSKPPGPDVGERILARAQDLGKPVVVSFVGQMSPGAGRGPKLYFGENLLEAAQTAAALIQGEPAPPPLSPEGAASDYSEGLGRERAAKSPAQRFVRGLYSGGTLADETAFVLARHLPEVRAGSGFGPVLPIQDWEVSRGNMVLDLGEDRFTSGRPHPMIDPGIRVDRIQAEARDPSVSVLILDVILGWNADENPGERLAPAIQQARETAASGGGSLSVFVHICGTGLDPQNLAAQTRLFENAGSRVFQSNVQAALAAVWMVRGRGEETASRLEGSHD